MRNEIDEQTPDPGQALTTSFASDGLDLFVQSGDTGIDALVSSGALDGVPILGLLHGIYKTSKHIPAILFQRKVARMLRSVAQATTLQERIAFTKEVTEGNQAKKLGETILLFLDKADEIEKPALIGR